MKIYDRLLQRLFKHTIVLQKIRIAHLERRLAHARRVLGESETMYVRAYVSRYWRGHTFDETYEKAIETLKQEEAFK